MKLSFYHLSTFLLRTFLGVLSVLVPGDSLRAQPVPSPAPSTPPPVPIELTRPQSAPRPKPTWVRYIDQGKQNDQLKGYQTPEGLKVEIVAEAPTVVNPVGMTFADDGIPHVLEWRPSPGDEWRETPVTFTYKDGSKRKVATMKKRVKDVVKTLQFNKEKGVYDRSKIILEEELPSSILLHDGWLYLASRGSVRRYKQSKPGGPYDVKEVIAKGFCGFHHHQVSGMTLGNDGWLYITSGDDDNHVEGSDGSRATVLRTGAVFRCRPDGSKMHTYAIGFRNPYRDVAFDTMGNMFHADNDNEDGSKFMGCRLMHIAEGCDFGWRLRIGRRCCAPDNARGSAFGELPGKVPAMLKTGRGAPAGLLIYNDTRFPESYRGLLLYPDAYRKLIRAYKVEQRGATFAVTHEFVFMKSDDPLFRPCQMVVGPDGAIYIVDWRTNSGGAGKLWGDGVHGRIYRVTWAGTRDEPALEPRSPDAWAKIASQSDEELVAMLKSPEASFRDRARRELAKRGPKNRKLLADLVYDADAPDTARVAALGALLTMQDKSVVNTCAYLLQASSDADLRRLAAEGIGLHAPARDKKAHATLLKALNEDDPAVLRAVALAMSRIGAPGAADVLANTLAHDDGKDPYLFDGLVRAVEGLGKEGIDALLALAESGVEKERNRVFKVFLTLRTQPGYDALPKLLANPHFTATQRAELVLSANNYLLDPPISLEPLATYFLAHADEAREVKLAGLKVLATPGTRKGEKTERWLLSLLGESDKSLRLAVLHAIGQIRPATAAPHLTRMLKDTSRSSNERMVVARTLLALNARSAVSAVQEVLVGLKGDNAPTEALRLQLFRTLAGLDSTVALPLAWKFLQSKNPTLQMEAVLVLGATPKGAREVGELFLAGKLPRTLLPQVAGVIRKHSGSNVKLSSMLVQVMKKGLLLANTPAEVARLRELVRKKGNPMRGRKLFLDSRQLACVNCHRLEGVGGNAGPDLTRIWETHTIDKILESILEPAKEIKEGYQTYRVVTKRGRVFLGLKVEQSAERLVLRDANAREVVIPAKQVESITASKQSLMPGNVVSVLNFTQFVDLIAFLKDRKAQESLRGQALEFWVIGPLAGKLDPAHELETKADPRKMDPLAGGKKLRWQLVRSEASGLLNLRKLFGKDNVSAYALTYLHSPKAQKAQMFVGSDDQVRVWINGKQVHEYTVPRSATADQDRVTVMLQAGWNTVLVKVANESQDHGLYLRFEGEGLHLASEPKAKK